MILSRQNWPTRSRIIMILRFRKVLMSPCFALLVINGLLLSDYLTLVRMQATSKIVEITYVLLPYN